jgi:hypothetical protein
MVFLASDTTLLLNCQCGFSAFFQVGSVAWGLVKVGAIRDLIFAGEVLL